MLVKDIMKTDVATISPFATIREAMRQMKARGVKSLVVEKQGEHDAWGIITYTTILRTIVAEEGDIDLINVYDVASKPVISVFSGMDVKHVARLMVNEDYRRLVVLRNNELEGIVTMNDIVTAVLAMVEE
ncbi:CBS domain-containing protein [Thioalkalivibrio thiocyanodenitrificans]|uniref:CBS domain-containing protein n=1 Tax=Thioalkalivibrio thiocyanodenitrificans TaxID=243063 RepID=UPI00037AE34C|nr:CBS domain-containing protein [Thioalkalivibrio thiocyanodenitrificans]